MGAPSSIPPRAPGATGTARAGEVKGIALRNFPSVLRALRGPQVLERTLGLLSPELRDAIGSGRIVASGWYPLAWYRELHQAASRATSNEPGLAWQIGRESTRLDLGGVYKVFLRILSPQYVLSISSRFFGVYYRPGTMRLVESRGGFGRVAFSRCYGFDHFVWNDVFGGCEITMELAGARQVRLRAEDGGRDGDTEATLIAWWSTSGESIAGG